MHPTKPKPLQFPLLVGLPSLDAPDRPDPYFAQDAPTPPAARSRRSRPAYPRSAQKAKRLRPGRFFHTDQKLAWYRRDMNPAHLGDADWLLYRRRFNPHRPGSYKSKAYIRGFEACKREIPRPNWPPL